MTAISLAILHPNINLILWGFVFIYFFIFIIIIHYISLDLSIINFMIVNLSLYFLRFFFLNSAWISASCSCDRN